MVAAEYLRHQADTCLRLARECFDLTTAMRLRLMADEFNAKADESDRDPTTVNGTSHDSGLPDDDSSRDGPKHS